MLSLCLRNGGRRRRRGSASARSPEPGAPRRPPRPLPTCGWRGPARPVSPGSAQAGSAAAPAAPALALSSRALAPSPSSRRRRRRCHRRRALPGPPPLLSPPPAGPPPCAPSPLGPPARLSLLAAPPPLPGAHADGRAEAERTQPGARDEGGVWPARGLRARVYTEPGARADAALRAGGRGRPRAGFGVAVRVRGASCARAWGGTARGESPCLPGGAGHGGGGSPAPDRTLPPWLLPLRGKVQGCSEWPWDPVPLLGSLDSMVLIGLRRCGLPPVPLPIRLASGSFFQA